MSASVTHQMAATALFNTSSGTDRDAGGGRSGFPGKAFITLSHVKTELSGTALTQHFFYPTRTVAYGYPSPTATGAENTLSGSQ